MSMPGRCQSKLLVGNIFPLTRTRAAPSTRKVEHNENNPRGKSKIRAQDMPFMEMHRPSRPSVASLRQFEALWLRYREEVQLGKQAAKSVLDDVAKGRLPCDPDMLRNRARTLLLLDPMLPHLRLRQLLASTPRALLAHDPKLILDRAQRFASLLPSRDTTQVLMTVAPYLDRDPVITAANLLELDDVFCRAFGGARVPPSVFAHLLRAPGATVLPPPQSSMSAFPSGSVAAASPLPPPPALNNENHVPTTAPTTARPQADGTLHRQAHVQQQQAKQYTKQKPYVLQEQDSKQQQLKQKQLPQGARRPRELLLVQRHPALLDRDPWDLGARAVQLLAAIDPRVSGLPMASPGGASAAFARPLARLLEDAPGTLDFELGEVQRRLQELSTALSWGVEQVAQLVLHDPLVLLRNPSSCRENFIRLRLYALRRPTSWGVELMACLNLNDSTAAATVAMAGAATPKGNGRRQHGEAMLATAAATAAAATIITDSVDCGRKSGDVQRVAAPLNIVTKELDAELLSLVARILTVDEELIDRFEYLVLTGQRSKASMRELLYESRMKFVRHCPRYSRWWAEGATRQRGEGGGVFGLGSGLEEGGLEKGTDEMGVNRENDREGGVKGAWIVSIEDDLEEDWVEGDDSVERLLDSDSELI
ncbi:hypothetical protein Vretifemale_2129 [Volvox reticuliferus]|nr:hypothetical protein Vretifemale_2129 [Volvox reticuliferus]